MNLQMSRYSRLKIDIDKLKYEKWSKYRFKQPKCIVLGPLKSQKRAKNEEFYVQEYRDITWNKKLGKIKT